MSAFSATSISLQDVIGETIPLSEMRSSRTYVAGAGYGDMGDWRAFS